MGKRPPFHPINEIIQDTRRLQKLVISLLALVLGVGFAFAGYYYWDRYIHFGDKSPMERNAMALEEAVRDNPQDVETRIALAEIYLGQGRYSDAIKHAQQVVDAYPEEDRPLLIIGISLVRLGKQAEAIEPLEQFVTIRSQTATAGADRILETAYYFLGESYLKLEQPEKAIPPLKNAIAIDRADADALYLLGKSHNQLGNPQAALPYLERAVRLVPDFNECYTEMISAYQNMNEPDFVNYAKGMQALAHKDYSNALEYLESTAQAQPEFAPVHIGLGLTYEGLHRYSEARLAIEQALLLDPEDFLAQQAYGRLQSITQ